MINICHMLFVFSSSPQGWQCVQWSVLIICYFKYKCCVFIKEGKVREWALLWIKKRECLWCFFPSALTANYNIVSKTSIEVSFCRSNMMSNVFCFLQLLSVFLRLFLQKGMFSYQWIVWVQNAFWIIDDLLPSVATLKIYGDICIYIYRYRLYR